MQQIRCPKCRQPVTDAHLDAGACPSCGYDGPVELPGTPATAWLRHLTAAVALGSAAIGIYLLIPRSDTLRPGAELSVQSVQDSHPVAPAVPAPTRSITGGLAAAPSPHDATPAVPLPPHRPNPWVIDPPKPEAPAKVPSILLDPREAPGRMLDRRLDYPQGTAAVPDLNGNDVVKIAGRARLVKIGSVAGDAVLDASGLAADEIVVSGDISGRAVVKLNAPNGKVIFGGHATGQSRITVNARGGELILLSRSGRLGGNTDLEISSGRVVLDGPAGENARISITFTAGGFLRTRRLEGNARIVYRKAAASDPEPTLETGELPNGTAIVFER